ncbi:thiamine diphosphokinase [Cognatiyoonia koreensis]|uniref:Thiamine diphosphokinase n=1 Tax=Cognatiyoonia koreensis TaxID=364200 RepID=A0A1I0Q5V0_9RHOB|nr:thiamine diphosphokinase [Cognatiyoonia koreensis]SEW22344.1 thiamine diphosphokinase [Cognatiyoonia koreensis]
MHSPIVSSSSPITVLGGAELGTTELNISLNHAPSVVAADGGADHALAHGCDVAAVIGDLDSISKEARSAFADVIHLVTESDTTDFEKTLSRISAPLILGCGFLGGRLDHQMAVVNVLARYAHQPVILLSTTDVVFLSPARMRLAVPVGTRIGLLPLATVKAQTTGLRWNLDGVDLHPTRWVSSSNEAADDTVSVVADGPLLITLPLAQLDAAIAAVRAE